MWQQCSYQDLSAKLQVGPWTSHLSLGLNILKNRICWEFSLPCAHVSSSSSATCTVLWCWQGHCLANYQCISLSQYQNPTYFSKTSFLCYPGTLFHLQSGPLTWMYKLLHVLVLKALSENSLVVKSGSAEVWLHFCHWFTAPLGIVAFSL